MSVTATRQVILSSWENLENFLDILMESEDTIH